MAVAEITVDELAAKLVDNPATLCLIDVREVDEYEAGHVPGARLVVLASVPDHVDAFRSPDVAYVICKTGARSRRACEFLADQGVTAVNVAGGTLGWINSGRDVVTGDQSS